MEISPLVAVGVPLAVLLLRQLSATLADNPWASIAVATLLGGLAAFAQQAGIPLGVESVGAGIASALAGIGGVEAAKVSNRFRRVNRSRRSTAAKELAGELEKLL